MTNSFLPQFPIKYAATGYSSCVLALKMQDVCNDRADLAQMILCLTFLGWGFIFFFHFNFFKCY